MGKRSDYGIGRPIVDIKISNFLFFIYLPTIDEQDGSGLMKLNGKIAELLGAIIGDGNLWTDGRHYRVEPTGDPDLDAEYFQYLSEIISNELSGNPKRKIRQRGLRIRVCSKELFEYFSDKLEIPVGSGKAKKVKIPKYVVESSWKIKSKCIRGIADSDGSFFFSDKGYRKDYPTIEITTTSKNLARQLEAILEDRNFRLGFREWVPREEWNTKYIISINGDEMCKKWLNEIGFSNPRHHQKLNKI